MTRPRHTVLLVEDEVYDRLLAERFLSDDATSRFDMEAVVDLDAAIARLATGGIDVVLLDLNLPGSSGLDTLRAVKKAAPTVATVVITGAADTAQEAVSLGAQDYIDKNTLDRHLLKRTLAYAIERQAVLNDLRRQFRAWADVLQSLRHLPGPKPLQKREAGAFAELVQSWAGLLGRTAGGQRRDDAYRARLAEVVRRLAATNASVADLLDIHLSAVGQRSGGTAAPSRDEEEHVILEVMAHLLNRHRSDASTRRSAKPREG